jgi:hypothetical protein
MSARGRIGGYSRAARYPSDELTRGARAGFLKRFEPTDPDLSEAERQRRTQCALKAYMAGLARKSALARHRQ